MTVFDLPTDPTLGDEYTSGGVTYKWNGYGWAVIGAVSKGMIIGDDLPASPVAGDMWWELDTGQLWLYYDDGTSQQWVQINSTQGPKGDPGPVGPMGPAAPSIAAAGFRATKSVHQTGLPSATRVKVTFPVETYDQGGYYDPALS